jgi:type IV secretory pathway TrbF-like protein
MARQEWDERYGDLISRAKNWRRIAFLSMSTTLVAMAVHLDLNGAAVG